MASPDLTSIAMPSSRRGAIALDRRLAPSRDGLVVLRQAFSGSDTRTVVTHGAFLLARVEVVRGGLSFPLASGTVVAPRRFAFVLPPRSVLPMAFEGALVRSEGVSGFAGVWTAEPALLAWPDEDTPFDLATVQRLAGAPVLAPLPADAAVAPTLVEARALLHELLAHPAPLRMAAARLGVRADSLSRAFHRAYGLAPKRYCHQARLFEAALRLLTGAAVLEAAFDAGFGDLKRFYTQFKRFLGATPGSYARAKKRQDTLSGRAL